ncbi:MAG: type II secretion system F family protein [Thermoplasmata archaeon]|nr:MAG: type II secretion system F family protein [Thermoplasmata archaeon]
MKYFNVTVMDKGKKRLELIKADSKMGAVKSVKHKFPSAMVLRSVETTAPLEDSLNDLLKGLKKTFKSKIPINDKISTIRQIAVMTDAGIPINDTLEDVGDNTAKFKKAIRSPLITLGAMGIAFTILIMVVVPKFKDIFDKFKTDLPVPTQILLKLEWAFSNYGMLILIILFAMIFTVKYLYKNNRDFQYSMDKMMIHPKFYLINKAIFLSTMHKYNLVFGELVKAGIPVSEALDTAVGMVDNLVIKEKLLTVNANIGRGMNLAEAFKITGLYQNMLLQMIKAGESGGQLDAMLDKVTQYYDMEFQDLIDNLAAYIEPILMFFIAGLVLLMALGIFMPMWDLGKAVKN